MKEAAAQSFPPTNEEGDEKSVSMCDGGGVMILQGKVEIPEPIARGMSSEQGVADGKILHHEVLCIVLY